MPRILTRRSVVLAALALPALAACSGGQDTTGTTGSTVSDAGASADAFPVTVEHLYGTTEISAAPTRIATVSWVNADTVLAQETRSEEHTSELQSRENLVCRLLLEKKKI